jgi:hypothetical protein
LLDFHHLFRSYKISIDPLNPLLDDFKMELFCKQYSEQFGGPRLLHLYQDLLLHLYHSHAAAEVVDVTTTVAVVIDLLCFSLTPSWTYHRDRNCSGFFLIVLEGRSKRFIT